MDKNKEGSKSFFEAYLDGFGKVLLFVGGVFVFRAVNEIYDRYLASEIKPLPPRRK